MLPDENAGAIDPNASSTSGEGEETNPPHPEDAPDADTTPPAADNAVAAQAAADAAAEDEEAGEEAGEEEGEGEEGEGGEEDLRQQVASLNDRFGRLVSYLERQQGGRQPPAPEDPYKGMTAEQIAKTALAEVAALKEEQASFAQQRAIAGAIDAEVDAAVEKFPDLGEWEDDIKLKIAYFANLRRAGAPGAPPNPVQAAIGYYKQKIVGAKTATVKKVVTPLKVVSKTRTVPAGGGAAPPPAKRKPQSYEDIARGLSRAIPNK